MIGQTMKKNPDRHGNYMQCVKECIITACCVKDLEPVRLCVAAKFNLGFMAQIIENNISRTTSPIFACIESDEEEDSTIAVEKVKMIIRAINPSDLDAKLNIKNSDEQTPLSTAIRMGKYKMVDYLLRSGANVKIAIRDFANAIQMAQCYQDEKVLKVLRLMRLLPQIESVSPKDQKAFDIVHLGTENEKLKKRNRKCSRRTRKFNRRK